MDLSRRSFLKSSGALTWGAITATLFTPVLFRRNLYAGNDNNNRRVIVIFQRGGNDGLNTVIPRGDAEYNANNRPTLFIPDNLAIDSGNGFAQFHPALQPMMEVYNHTSINGQAGLGNLAVIHRVGYSGQSRSHFDSQFYWENGTPGNDELTEGSFYRHLDRTVNLADINNSFVAAALSSSQILALKGPKPIPNFTRASSYNLTGGTATATRFLGKVPGSPGSPNGTGLLGIYGSAHDQQDKIYRSLVHDTGKLMGATIDTLQAAVAQGAYTPENGAVYPNTTLGQRLTEAAMLLKRTTVKVLAVDIGGWDTHTGQGQVTGSHAGLLGQVANSFQALSRDLQSMWNDVLIVTNTEFGRTSQENGSRGTDHAEACVVFAAGGCVNGGVYNCDSTTWDTSGVSPMFQKSGRYLSRRTDYRAVMGEVFTRFLGDSNGLLNEIIPGYDAAAAANPSDFAPLNYIRTS
ncbi:MAG TPA: hypothetical protein DCY13_04925 [Verrucomicrobiales bacterium]|nr:hypothetical protein [Verrucomicrobiales bacterium]